MESREGEATLIRSWRLLIAAAVLGTFGVADLALGETEEPPAHPTLTTVSCKSPVQPGESARCTATVEDLTPPEIAVTPRGEVLFSSDRAEEEGSFTGTCSLTTLRTGASRCSIEYTPDVVGVHTITGSYPGQGGTGATPGLDPSEGIAGVEAAKVDPTTTAVSCTPSVIGVGESTTCRATVTDRAASPQPSGLLPVFFNTDDPGVFSSRSCSVAFDGEELNEAVSCQVTYSLVRATDTPHNITATFTGDARHEESQGATQVRSLDTEITVHCDPDLVKVGETAACTVTVEDVAAAPAPPTGSVEFEDGGSGIFDEDACTLSAGTEGKASCQIAYRPTSAAGGVHTISASYQGDQAHDPANGVGRLSVLNGVVRFAAPGGTGAEPCEDPAAPCSLSRAAEGARAGDEVVLAPGTYQGTNDLGSDLIIGLRAGVFLHGAAGEPRPLILQDDPGALAAIFVSTNDRLSHLEIESNSRNGIAFFGDDATAEGLVVRSTGDSDATACDLGGADGLLVRSTACLASGPGSTALGGDSSSTDLSATVRLRHVTATSTGPDSFGIAFEVGSPGQAPIVRAVDAAAVIADGTARDVVAETFTFRGNDKVAGLDVELRNSAYQETSATATNGGVAIVTPAGSGTNILAAPQLGGDRVHQLPGSPTVNAGPTDGFAGESDVDGELRALGPAADIGADEFGLLTTTELVCAPGALVLDEASTCTATVTDTTSPASAPRGKVEFKTDGPGAFRSKTPTCTLAPAGEGQASCQLLYVPAEVGSGRHRISAAYLANFPHFPSDDDATLDVRVENPERERTGTTVVCDPNPTTAEGFASCTATVAAATTPTGIVQLTTNGPGSFDDGGPFCTLQPSEELAGEASCDIGYFPSAAGTGSHRIDAAYQGDQGHRPSNGSTSLLVANSIRYAAPGGTGDDPCNIQEDPCTLFVAADAAAPDTTIEAGDLVLMEPGNYSDSAGDLGPNHRVILEPGARLRGAGGAQSRPVITLDEPILGGVAEFMGLTVRAGSTASHLEIRSATAPTAIFIQGGVVEDVIARSDANEAVVCNQSGGLVRDSVCLTSGAGAIAFGAKLAQSEGGAAEFRNVTAISTGGPSTVGTPSAGVQFSFRNTGAGDRTFSAHGVGVIASGTSSDVIASAEGAAPTEVDLELEHSDYATTAEQGGPGSSAEVTPAGSGTNITAEPLFAEDGFHQREDSPTVDAGFVEGLSGAADIDGQRRTLGSAPDIGADERSATTVADFNCDPRGLGLGETTTCTVSVEDTSATSSAPNGTVRFLIEGGTGDFSRATCPLAPLGKAKARCKVTYVPTAVGTGTHELTARFEGSLDQDPSHATDAIEVTAERNPTETTLVCDPASVGNREAAACTVTVTDVAEAGIQRTRPTGEVAFDTDSPGDFSTPDCDLEPAGPDSAACQVVTYTPTVVQSGTHTLEASYGSDATHASSAGSFELTVRETGGGGGDKNPTSTALECVPQSVEANDPTTCTATVTALAASQPTGKVTFDTDSPGDFSAPECDLEPAGPDSATCQVVTYTPTVVQSGTHTLEASYGSDATHASSVGSFALGVRETEEGGGGRDKRITTTALLCQPPAVSLGGGSVCTAIVEDTTATDPPTGVVELSSDGVGSFDGECRLFPSGPASARCQTIYDPEEVGSGTHVLTASYQGDASHATSLGSTQVTVDDRSSGADTATVLECKPSIVIRGGVSICTANVKGLGPNPTFPPGVVFFASDSAGQFSSGSCLLFAVGAGESRCQVIYRPSQVDSGTHRITAIYAGSLNHEPSRNSNLVNVEPPNGGHPTTTTLDCQPPLVALGNATTCTAIVTDDDADPSNPTRAVVFASNSAGTFDLGGCQLAPLGADRATCKFTYTPTAVRSGTHRISAAYEGDPNHEPSPVVVDEVRVTQGGGNPGGGNQGGVTQPPGQGSAPPQIGRPGNAGPNTTLRKKPRKKTAKRKAVFRFVSDQPGSTFQCKLDKKPFKACRSPWKKKVKPGRHTFRVRAVNAQGVTDPTPAVFKWKVGKA